MTELDLSGLSARLRAAANSQLDEAPNEDMNEVFRELSHASYEDADRITDLVATELSEITSPTGVGLLSVWLGAGVENGRPAELSTAAVIGAFKDLSRKLRLTDDESAELLPGQELLLSGLRQLGSAVVTHFAHMPEAKRTQLDLDTLRRETERIEHVSNAAIWVLHVLDQQSGDLIVLIVDKKRGYRISYRNITNCFHLFTLLQSALAEEKPKRAALNTEAIAVAEGRANQACTDRAWWHYGQPFSSEADIAASVWGEATPSEIARIDGTQVLLVWPPMLGGRSWDAGFLTPYLEAAPPEVKATSRLSASEIDSWWQRLRLPAPNPWWKVW